MMHQFHGKYKVFNHHIVFSSLLYHNKDFRKNIGNYRDILLLIYLILSAKCSVATWIVKSVSDSKLLLQTLHKLLAEDLSEVVLLVEKFCSSMGSFLISLSLTTKSSFSVLIWPTPETNWQENRENFVKFEFEKNKVKKLTKSYVHSKNFVKSIFKMLGKTRNQNSQNLRKKEKKNR